MKSTKVAAKLAASKPVQKTRKSGIPEMTAPATAAVTVTAIPVQQAPIAQPQPKIVTPTPAVAKKNVTVIDVKADVGYGNAIFVRGQGAGLSWEKGVPLECVDSSTWRWSGEAKDSLTFKLLINDQVWATGNDLTVAPGEKLEVTPAFA
jgi:hypothetical protein